MSGSDLRACIKRALSYPIEKSFLAVLNYGTRDVGSISDGSNHVIFRIMVSGDRLMHEMMT